MRGGAERIQWSESTLTAILVVSHTQRAVRTARWPLYPKMPEVQREHGGTERHGEFRTHCKH